MPCCAPAVPCLSVPCRSTPGPGDVFIENNPQLATLSPLGQGLGPGSIKGQLVVRKDAVPEAEVAALRAALALPQPPVAASSSSGPQD